MARRSLALGECQEETDGAGGQRQQSLDVRCDGGIIFRGGVEPEVANQIRKSLKSRLVSSVS